ncbi:purine nucleoside permease [Sphingomonas oleivorans]|uniref:Purine nucleoside permease n=1 Tax=Sphingomonas oleivorans TaxID=1735121 RepID=A0A2T5FYB2_9SPHN|nr:purine nucleoside permease [Sphingomonas oleivorans]PTQ11520.1 purine nucleoside permease [Sphingomonas oleivorans]
MKTNFRSMLLASALALLPAVPAAAQPVAPAVAAVPVTAPIPVRVVVVTAFEIGEDTGDKAGEFQAWAQVLPEKIPFPAGYRDLHYDPKTQVLAINTSIGTSRAAASIMALGMDPRFDLRKSYWLIAAIAGVNPNTGSIGSAAWIGDVVDTDHGYLIDPREAPKDWVTGMFPRERTRPYQLPVPQDSSYNLFPANKDLRDWAYKLTKDVKIPDSDTLRTLRAAYKGYPQAEQPPRVLVGDEVSGQGFWHGAMLNAHFERWAEYWTGRKDSFVMTAMEDTGVIQSLSMLGRVGKVDPNRLLVLRTGSNYSTQPKGGDAAASLASESTGLSALQASLDAAFLVGNRVVQEISRNWSQYADKLPSVR